MIKTIILTFLFLWIFYLTSISQKLEFGVPTINIGIDVKYHFGKGNNFPGFGLFVSGHLTGQYQNYYILNYGVTMSLYHNSMGANYSNLNSDYQIDIVNSFHVGYGNKDNDYKKLIRSLNNTPHYNFVLEKKYLILLGSNFIFNFKGRNQINGSIILSSPLLTINYYNDGGPPMAFFGLSDGFDRYWTGGIGIFIHSDSSNHNILEFSFDQFTDYAPLTYEFSNMLGINVPSYSNNGSPSYNTSSYKLSFFLDRELSINAGVVGGLRSKDGKVWGLQDIIHLIRNIPLHPNRDQTRFFIGTSINSFL